MIFYFNASGDSIGMSPERVYQGSNKANKVYVVCPIPRSAIVSVTYDLPNGDKSASFIMNNVMLENQKEMVDKHGITFNMWEVDLEEIASAYCGCVGVQFTFSLSSGEKLNSSYQRFYVERGVEVAEPEQGDTYQEVLSFLSSLNLKLNEIENSVKNNTTALKTVNEDIEKIDGKFNVQSQRITENRQHILSTQSMYNELSGVVSRYSSRVSEVEKELKIVSNVINDAMVYSTEIKDKFSDRITANGLKVVNGTATQLVKVYGDTVEGTDGNFKDAIFYGIQSSCANMFNLGGIEAIESEGRTLTKIEKDGALCIDGVVNKNETIAIIKTKMPAGRHYSLGFEFLGGNATDLLGNPLDSSINIFMIGYNYETSISANKGTTFCSGVVGEEGNEIIITMVANNTEDVVFDDYKFRVMAVEGEYNSSNMLRHSNYVAPTTFCLSQSVSLGKYDYLDFEREAIVRQTGYVVKESPLSQEEIATYPNATVSSDGKKLFYKLQNSTALSFGMEKEYKVYNGGREKLVYQANDEVNGCVTVRQKYLVKLGE